LTDAIENVEERFMQSDTQPAPVSKWMFWAGWIISALTALFLLFDGAMKLLKTDFDVKATVVL